MLILSAIFIPLSTTVIATLYSSPVLSESSAGFALSDSATTLTFSSSLPVFVTVSVQSWLPAPAVFSFARRGSPAQSLSCDAGFSSLVVAPAASSSPPSGRVPASCEVSVVWFVFWLSCGDLLWPSFCWSASFFYPKIIYLSACRERSICSLLL